MEMALATILAVAVLLLVRWSGGVIRGVWLALWCSHIDLHLEVVGSAAISMQDQSVEMTVEARCTRCGWFIHRPLDASAALREGLGVKR